MLAGTWDRYRATLDSLLEGFQVLSPDWTYLYVNPAAARHGRSTPAQLMGRRMTELYPGIEQTPLFEKLERCMTKGEVASFENLFTFEDGSTRWFEIRIQPVPEGVCVHSVDIQARKDAESRLRDQASVAALGRMAAVVAHEIKNPLAGISGALQVLKQRRAADPENKVIDEMLRSITSLDRLLQDLLIFARPIQVNAEAVPISDVLGAVVHALADDPRVSRHTVTLGVGEPAPVANGDRELLKNVFRNLILNAAQVMTAPGAIEIRAGRDRGVCRVTVTDSGPGVSAELATKLFEPFVSGRKGGSGLGLSISRHIVRLQGGELTLAAPGAQGATFVVTVPLHA